MKRRHRLIIVLLALVLLMAGVPFFGIFGNSAVAINIDGNPVVFADGGPRIVGGRVLVPVRGFFEHLGFDVDWNEANRLAVLRHSDFSVVVPEAGTDFVVNGGIITPDVSQQIVDGRMLLPLRAIVEALGLNAIWDSSSRTAIIVTNDGFSALPAPTPVSQPTTTATPAPSPLPSPTPVSPPLLTPAPLPSSEPTPSPITPQPTSAPVPTPSPAPIPSPSLPSRFTIPNRRLTEAEIALWIDIYSVGGANTFEIEIIELVNRERAAEGLAPLSLNTTLMAASRFKSQSMYDLDYRGHTSPVYGAFWNISTQVFGYVSISIGENLAWGQRTPAEAVYWWMNSPDHRANILDPYFTEMGAGFYNFLWTQKFGRS